MSIQLFFSPPEGDDAGVPVTEDTPDTGAGRKARQRKQRAQCAGIVHSCTLRVNETTFTPAQRARKHWNYSGFCMQTTVFDPQDSALTLFYIAIDYKEIARDIKGFARDFSHTARMEHAPPLTEQERMLLQSTRLNLRVGVENSHSNRLFIRDLQETCLFEEVGELEQLERADIIATIFRQYSGDKVGWRFYLRRPENPQNVVKVVFIEVYYWLQVYLDSSKPKADRHQYTDRLTVELIKASQTLFGKNELRSRDSMAITPNEKLSCKRIQE